MLSTKERWLYWGFVAFFATLFVPPVVPVVNNLVIAGVFVICLLDNSFSGKMRLLRSRWDVGLMIVFFLIMVVSAAMSVNQARAWSIVTMRSPMLLFPVSLGLITIRRQLRDRVMLAYGAVICAVAAACLVDAGVRAWVRRDTQWLYDDSLTKLIGRTSVYMALLVVIAIFSFLSLVESRVVSRWGRGFMIGGIGFLMVFHFLLASRISMFFLYAVLFGHFLWHVLRTSREGSPGAARVTLPGRRVVSDRGRRRKLLVAGGVVVMLMVVFAFAFPKTLNRFRQLRYTGYDYRSQGPESHYNMAVTPGQWNGVNFRLAVWRCGWDIYRRHPVFGVPLGDERGRLMEEYRVRGFVFAYTRHRNLHSTWLDVLVSTGVLGLVVFLLGWFVMPVVGAIRGGKGRCGLAMARGGGGGPASFGLDRLATVGPDWLGAGIVCAFACALVTESWIDGSFGSVLLGFWVPFVSASRRAREGTVRG